MPRPKVKKGRKWAGGHLVTYPVGYRYNGGVTHKGEWYTGFIVPPPIVPEGYRLMDIGIGLELNAWPPVATMLMLKI